MSTGLRPRERDVSYGTVHGGIGMVATHDSIPCRTPRLPALLRHRRACSARLRRRGCWSSSDGGLIRRTAQRARWSPLPGNHGSQLQVLMASGDPRLVKKEGVDMTDRLCTRVSRGVDEANIPIQNSIPDTFPPPQDLRAVQLGPPFRIWLRTGEDLCYLTRTDIRFRSLSSASAPPRREAGISGDHGHRRRRDGVDVDDVFARLHDGLDEGRFADARVTRDQHLQPAHGLACLGEGSAAGHLDAWHDELGGAPAVSQAGCPGVFSITVATIIYAVDQAIHHIF